MLEDSLRDSSSGGSVNSAGSSCYRSETFPKEGHLRAANLISSPHGGGVDGGGRSGTTVSSFSFNTEQDEQDERCERDEKDAVVKPTHCQNAYSAAPSPPPPTPTHHRPFFN